MSELARVIISIIVTTMILYPLRQKAVESYRYYSAERKRKRDVERLLSLAASVKENPIKIKPVRRAR